MGVFGGGVADGGFGQCVMPRLSFFVSGGELYYIVCNDVVGPLSTLLLSSTRALLAERMYPAVQPGPQNSSPWGFNYYYYFWDLTIGSHAMDY